MIWQDSRNSLNRHTNRAYESPAPPSCQTCGSKSISSYTSYGSRRRRSTFTLHARRFGPVTPQLIASAAEIFPTPSVRMWKTFDSWKTLVLVFDLLEEVLDAPPAHRLEVLRQVIPDAAHPGIILVHPGARHQLD